MPVPVFQPLLTTLGRGRWTGSFVNIRRGLCIGLDDEEKVPLSDGDNVPVLEGVTVFVEVLVFEDVGDGVTVTVGVPEGISEGIIVLVLVAVLANDCVDVGVFKDESDAEGVGLRLAEGTKDSMPCRTGKSFSTALQIVSLFQHSMLCLSS